MAVDAGATETGVAAAFPPQAITKSKAKNPVRAASCFNEIMDRILLFSPAVYEPVPRAGPIDSFLIIGVFGPMLKPNAHNLNISVELLS